MLVTAVVQAATRVGVTRGAMQAGETSAEDEMQAGAIQAAFAIILHWIPGAALRRVIPVAADRPAWDRRARPEMWGPAEVLAAVVVAVVEVLVAAVVVAVVVGVAKTMERTMRVIRWYGTATDNKWGWLLAFVMSVFIATGAHAENTKQRSFSSPEEAAQALAKSVKARNQTDILAVLGQDASSWISSGDAAADRAAADRFVKAYDAKHAFVQGGNKATLTLGEEDFPFAFPLVRNGERWRFDTAAGKEEMLVRRIGENELSAIGVLQAIVDAQLEYASEDRNGDGVLAYAQKFASSPGKHDGLYWPAKAGEEESPLGELLAKAAGEGYQMKEKGPTPYHGYYYRLLHGQGKNATSGQFDYVVHGRAIGGFAAIAYPARYGNSGIMTFIVNQDGKIFQSDLGPDTQNKAQKMQLFDPGNGWTPVPVDGQ
jgi:hypothetical protein